MIIQNKNDELMLNKLITAESNSDITETTEVYNDIYNEKQFVGYSIENMDCISRVIAIFKHFKTFIESSFNQYNINLFVAPSGYFSDGVAFDFIEEYNSIDVGINLYRISQLGLAYADVVMIHEMIHAYFYAYRSINGVDSKYKQLLKKVREHAMNDSGIITTNCIMFLKKEKLPEHYTDYLADEEVLCEVISWGLLNENLYSKCLDLFDRFRDDGLSWIM